MVLPAIPTLSAELSRKPICSAAQLCAGPLDLPGRVAAESAMGFSKRRMESECARSIGRQGWANRGRKERFTRASAIAASGFVVGDTSCQA